MLTLSIVVIIVSKRVTLFWRKTDFSQSIWPAGDQLTTAFTILNYLEHEFLKGFLVQGRQQFFWKFSILSNNLDLQWCLPNKWKIHSQLSDMFTCRDGRGGKLSSQASRAVYIASYKEPLDQSDRWKLFVQLWNYTNNSYYYCCCYVLASLSLSSSFLLLFLLLLQVTSSNSGWGRTRDKSLKCLKIARTILSQNLCETIEMFLSASRQVGRTWRGQLMTGIWRIFWLSKQTCLSFVPSV